METEAGVTGVTGDSTTSAWSSDQVQRFLSRLSEESFKNRVPVVAYLTSVSVVGCVGNVIVLLVYWLRFRPSATRVFVLAMALCDLVTNTISLPLQIATIRYAYDTHNDGFCKTMFAFATLTTQPSGCLLVLVALDRCHRICKPLQRQLDSHQGLLLSVGTVVFSILLFAPFIPLYGIHHINTTEPALQAKMCWSDDVYKDTVYPLAYKIVVSVVFFVGVFAMAVSYFLIGLGLWKRKKQPLDYFKEKTGTKNTENNSVCPESGQAVSGQSQGDLQVVPGQGQGDLPAVSGQGQGDLPAVSCEGQGDLQAVSGQGQGDLQVVSGHGQGDLQAVSGQGQGDLQAVSGQGQGDLQAVSGHGQGDLQAVSGQGQGDLQVVPGQGQGDLQAISGQGQGDLQAGYTKGSEVEGEHTQGKTTADGRSCTDSDKEDEKESKDADAKDIYKLSSSFQAKETDLRKMPKKSDLSVPGHGDHGQRPSTQGNVPCREESGHSTHDSHWKDVSHDSYWKDVSHDSHWNDVTHDSHWKDFTRDSHWNDVTHDSHWKDVTRDSHWNDVTHDSHWKDVTRDSHWNDVTHDSHWKDVTHDSHWKDVSHDSHLTTTTTVTSCVEANPAVMSSQPTDPGGKGKDIKLTRRPVSSRTQRMRSRTTLMMSVLTLFYIINWLPHLVMRNIRSDPVNWCDDFVNCGWNTYALGIRSYYLNSAVNAFVYSFCNARFRQEFRELFSSWVKKSRYH